jgi:8-oxo-dGTP pyrophosphatase MutT (NUDIX family)
MINTIEKIFSERQAKPLGIYKKSAVMILLQESLGELYIIFEVRSHKLKHQPGDVCLPGGRLELSETPKEAAIRETKEELNLKSLDFEVIGEMDYFVSPYNSIIYPYVGKLHVGTINASADEVHEIIKIPLNYFLNTEPLLYELEIGPNLKEDFPFHLIKGGRNYKFASGKLGEYFYEYNDYVIWGFTAIIIREFINILKE